MENYDYFIKKVTKKLAELEIESSKIIKNKVKVTKLLFKRNYYCPFCFTKLNKVYKANYCFNCGRSLVWDKITN